MKDILGGRLHIEIGILMIRPNLYRTFLRAIAWFGIIFVVVLTTVTFMHMRLPLDAFGIPVGITATFLRAGAIALLTFTTWLALCKQASAAQALTSAFLALLISVLGLILIEGLVWVIRIAVP